MNKLIFLVIIMSMLLFLTACNNNSNFNNMSNISGEANDLYIKIEDANLNATGVYTTILVRYNDTLYGKSYAIIDYAANPNGPIGVIDKLIDNEYVPKYNGETNVEEILNATVDSIGGNTIVLNYNNNYVLFEKITEQVYKD